MKWCGGDGTRLRTVVVRQFGFSATRAREVHRFQLRSVPDGAPGSGMTDQCSSMLRRGVCNSEKCATVNYSHFGERMSLITLELIICSH